MQSKLNIIQKTKLNLTLFPRNLAMSFLNRYIKSLYHEMWNKKIYINRKSSIRICNKN